MTRSLLGKAISCCAMGLLASQALAAEPAPLDRTILPIPEPARPLYKEIDARNVKVPPRFEVKAPDGAPNVVIVLIDDLGFGVPTAFGGPVSMPTLDALAQQGLRYNNFHTTALCSPTRAALKSGRNHHTVNMAFITEMATGLPGATGQIPNATAPLAETLRLNGYATAAFGKWHETAAWEASVAGPFDRWPTRQGFDKFYGFIGGETNQWAPFLYDGTAVVELPHDPNYHFMTDMTDKAVAWIKYQKALTPQKPSFIYFAPGATHAPAPRAEGMDRALEGQVRPGLGQDARGNPRPADQDGHRPAGHQARAEAAGDPRLGHALCRREAPVHAPGRGVRRVRGIHRSRDRPHAQGVRRRRPGRQHARRLHRRRQRHQRRRRTERHVQRVHVLQRRAGDRCADAAEDRPVGRSRDLSAHGVRLGGRIQFAVRLDEAGAVGLRRHAQRHGHVLAQGHQGEERDPHAVQSRDRRGADHPRGHRPAGAEGGQRHAADPDGRHEPRVHVRGCEGEGASHHAVLRDRRQPRHLSRRLVRPHDPPGAVGSQAASNARRTTPRGSCTTRARISAWRTTSRRRIRRSSRSSRRYSCRKPRSITCCRWTIASSSAWMAPRWVVPTSWQVARR